MHIWVVIPVYNEQRTIRKVVQGVYRLTKKIIVINDASTDLTHKILKKLPVIAINNKYREGYVKSLESGLRKAFSCNADYAISFDGDGQHLVKDLQKVKHLIHKYQVDIVLGKRARKNRFIERIFGLYARTRYGFSDPLCGMKAFRKEFFNKYGGLEKRYTIATEIVFQGVKDGASFKELAIETAERLDKPRFAGRVVGNLLELRAMINIIFWVDILYGNF